MKNLIQSSENGCKYNAIYGNEKYQYMFLLFVLISSWNLDTINVYCCVSTWSCLFTDVDIETFLTFKKISSLTKDVIQIRKALSHSDFFEVIVDILDCLYMYVYFKIIWLWNACCIHKNIIHLVMLFGLFLFSSLMKIKLKWKGKHPFRS